jgi:formate dehydrogenase maturation protein FdhE
MLTKEEKENSVERPNHCPYCESEHISAGDHNFEDEVCMIYVECEECHKTWTDVYRLVSISED